MSLLTPERVPVNVYTSEDIGAPQLDKTPGCVSTIYKACLFTGYGDKEGAGWTMPFEDAAAGLKVFRPEIGAERDFYLRLSSDTGKEVVAQVYLDMTDASTGDLKLQCDTSFKYAKATASGKWLLVASSRGVWFFCEHKKTGLVSKTGSYFFAGDTSKTNIGQRLVYLSHTGGTGPNFAYSTITAVFDGTPAVATTKTQTYLSGKALLADETIATSDIFCLPDGVTQMSSDTAVMPVMIAAGGNVCLLPGVYIPFNGAAKDNFDILLLGSSSVTVFGSGNYDNSNLYVATESWGY